MLLTFILSCVTYLYMLYIVNEIFWYIFRWVMLKVRCFSVFVFWTYSLIQYTGKFNFHFPTDHLVHFSYFILITFLMILRMILHCYDKSSYTTKGLGNSCKLSFYFFYTYFSSVESLWNSISVGYFIVLEQRVLLIKIEWVCMWVILGKEVNWFSKHTWDFY